MRAKTRFEPNPLDSALIQFKWDKDLFVPEAVGLILNESFTGSALVINMKIPLQSGHIIVIKVGQLPPMPAKIVWVKELDKDIYKFGVEYID